MVFLHMDMAVMLAKCPGPFGQLFIVPIPGGYTQNLVTTGPVVSEEKSFEIVKG